MLRCYSNANNMEKFQLTLDRMMDVLFDINDDIKDIISEFFKKNDIEFGECEIDKKGVCSKCNCVLKSIDLTEKEKDDFKNQLYRIMSSCETRKKSVDTYIEFLKNHKDYDVFLDSANIGYYAQNFDDGEFSFQQIDKVYENLKNHGHKCLLLLHSSHTKQKNEYLKKWERSGDLYLVHPGNNDDWYWMYGAITSELPNVKIVSNDLMRDHYFQILSPKYFQIWRERHEIKYVFRGERVDRFPYFYFPEVYSKRSQYNDDKENKIKTWHFPIIKEIKNENDEVLNEYKWYCGYKKY